MVTLISRNCLVCGGELDPSSKQTKYCSDSCNSKAKYQRNKAAKLEQNAKWKAANREHRLAKERELYERVKHDPKYKFRKHKNLADFRGIPFTLTYEDWWKIWEPHWEDRGRGGMVMCRTADKGGYELGNVRIDTHANNIREAFGVELQ